MAEIDNLQIRISADTMKAINAINKLTRSMDKLKTTIGSGIGFDELARQTNSFARAIKNHLNVLERYAVAMERIAKASRSMPKVTERAVKKTEGAKDSGDMPLLEGTRTMPVDTNPKLPFWKNWFQKFSINADKATKSAGLFTKTLKRMIMYMALRTAIQGVIKSLKEGTDLVYKYAQATESASEKSRAFVQTMDAIASASLQTDVAMGSLRESFSGVELFFKEKWASLMSTISENMSMISAYFKGEETYWGVNTDAVKKYDGALKALTSRYDELNTLSNANNVDYKDLLEEKSLTSGHYEYGDGNKVVWVADSISKANEKVNETLKEQVALKEKLDKIAKEQVDKTMMANLAQSAEEAYQNTKKIPDAIDILNGKSRLTLLDQARALNAELRSSIALTEQLANASTHTGTSNTTSSRVIKGNLGGGGLGMAMIDLQAYAGGGFLDSGELFVARENGLPEMVGTIGGAGAVANNADIVAAIAQGVADAITSGRMAVSVENFEGPARSLLKTLDNSATMRRLGGL